jgi:hypothetical protein
MSTLTAWVLSAILSCFVHPDAISPPRSAEIQKIAEAIADASFSSPLPDRGTVETAALLVGIAKLESGFRMAARGALGEVGVFQLMPPAPSGLEAQAREAIRRWRVQGPSGYCGEPRSWFGPGPLARNRNLWGAIYAAAHPFPDPTPFLVLAREP